MMLSVEEATEEIRAILADRNTTDRQRAALQMILRMAQRGRHLSSTRLPAVSSTMQTFVQVRAILDDARERMDGGIRQIADAAAAEEPDPEDR